MPAISVERTIGATKRAVLGGLIRLTARSSGGKSIAGSPSRCVRKKKSSAASSARSG
jgi:hypothetical protein